MNKIKPEIVVLDFGGQYTQLIAKKIRKLGYYTEIVFYDISLKQLKQKYPKLKALVLSGGPNSVYDKNAYKIDSEIWKSDFYILGICYGMQLLVNQNKGVVDQSQNGEYGLIEIQVDNKEKLFMNMQKKQNVFMSHSDNITNLGCKFDLIASSKNCIAAIKHKELNFYGVQFHLEVDHTENGEQILLNFCDQIANLEKNWSMKSYVKQKIIDIRKIVKKEKVLLAISGGVDSSVAAVLIKKAIKDQLHCIFINTGLLRKNEVLNITKYYNSQLGLNFINMNAKKQFLDGLKNVTNPEEKRKIVGKLFIDTFNYYCIAYKEFDFLAQGTIYSDVIESSHASKQQKVIKSHHNVGGLPKNLNFKLLEPLRDLFKDEVRELGKELGIDSKILNQHPYPGPGLSIRIIGEVTAEKIEILQKIDDIYLQTLEKNGYYDLISQAAVFLLPVKAVGVKGDNRAYGYCCVLRAVKTNDFMTASVCELPYKLLNELSTKIINQVDEITRVLYDITSKPPGTIEWE